MSAQVPTKFLPTYRRVLGMIEDGLSLNEIARRLNEQNVPTSRGGRWYASTVQGIRDSQTARSLS